MALELIPTTLLEAINEILVMSGERPVPGVPSDGLPSSGVLPAVVAENTLHRISREVQSEGLESNTEIQFELNPDAQGFINIPTDVLKIDAHDRGRDIVRRGNRLYDRKEQTFVFPQEPFEVDMVLFQNFEDIPEPTRRFITIRSARKVILEFLRDKALYQIYEKEELEARIAYLNDQWQTGEYTTFQSLDTFSIIDREPREKGRGLFRGFLD